MSEYYIGDKVYLEGKISEYDENDNTYCVDYFDYHKDTHSTVWVEDDVLHPTDEAYNKGLNDGWELAKKIVVSPTDGGYTAEELMKIFGTMESILNAYTPQEALAKVKAYEEEHDEIKVGDVVRSKGCSVEGIVTKVSEACIFRLFKDGSCCGISTKTAFKNFEKTGKHFDSIDEFMRSAD